MPIQNRDLGLSEQRDVLEIAQNGAVVTGASIIGPLVPFASVLEGAYFSALGLSGAPGYMLNVLRFTAGGATTIALGVSAQLVSAPHGASALQGWSGIRAPGSSLLNLLPGDALLVTSSVANTAAEKLMVSVVIKKTADIVSAFGLST
jgi:hypothetical protein